jgi:caffeoyl-CoA O-methyltransferase
MATPKSFLVPPALHDYMRAHSDALDAVRRRLIDRTAALGDVAGMQVAPEQGELLTAITRFASVRRAVEVGTFTGYSSLSIAMGLAPGGSLLCCDVSEEWTAIAREAWADAGVADRIELRLAPAADTLRSLPPDPVIDLAFIDADKPGYITYFDELVPRLRPGGLLLVDNTLWSGVVIDDTVDDRNTEAVRAFNRHAVADDRVDTFLLPVADGLTFCQRRG